MGEAYRTWIILYCTYQKMYTVHEVFIVHTHRCNLLLFTHEKCDNEV